MRKKTTQVSVEEKVKLCNFCICTSKGSTFKFCNLLSLIIQTEPNLHYYILGKGIKQDFKSHSILVFASISDFAETVNGESK